MSLRLGRTRNVQEAPIVKLLSCAKIPSDAISLGQGLPFFGPPSEVVSSISKVLSSRRSFEYTEDAGARSFRDAIADKLQKENLFKVDPQKNIIVTAGGNQAFVIASMMVTDIGDEIILPSPYYFNHKMAIELVGCHPIFVDTDENYQLDALKIFEKITEKTKAIVTISPNNPTGIVYSENTLKEINNYCRDNKIYHISDEVYEHFLFDNATHTSPAVFDINLKHTISIFSFSKSFGMGGYRIGYMVVPVALYNEGLKVQDTVGVCAPAIAQIAAEAAYRSSLGYTNRYLPTIAKTRKIFIERLKGLSYLEMPTSKGAFYFFLKLHTKKSSWDIAKKLIEKYGVITIPGDAFGATFPSLRLSYGNLTEFFAEEGISRLINGLDEIL